MHEQTTFSHVVVPPRSRGTTWSRFKSLRSKVWPQYWQVFLSRSKTLWRVNFTSFFGNRSKSSRTITRGTRIFHEIVVNTSCFGAVTEKSRQLAKSVGRKIFVGSDETTLAWPW